MNILDKINNILKEEFKVGDIIKEKPSKNMDTGRRMKITKIDDDKIEGIDLETKKKIHGIFNKLYILRKSIDKDKFYDFLLSEMRSEETKKLTEFIMKEGLLLGTFEGDIPINWKLHLDEIKKEVKIKGGIKNEGNRFT